MKAVLVANDNDNDNEEDTTAAPIPPSSKSGNHRRKKRSSNPPGMMEWNSAAAVLVLILTIQYPSSPAPVPAGGRDIASIWSEKDTTERLYSTLRWTARMMDRCYFCGIILLERHKYPTVSILPFRSVESFRWVAVCFWSSCFGVHTAGLATDWTMLPTVAISNNHAFSGAFSIC